MSSIDRSLLTPADRLALLSGDRLWKTVEVAHAGVRPVVMADGPNGVRVRQAELVGRDDSDDFASFLFLADGSTTDAGSKYEPSTCFPTGATLSCSWDNRLAYEMGAALAQEARDRGVQLLLGPGMNLRRTPLAGRSSEYFSEDPWLTAELAIAIVRGIQDHGIGACVKHFAANNSEVERTTMDSVIEERALRDVYLRTFERVVAEAKPWAIMSSYNKVNGVTASQNRRLLTEILRDEWGYDGVVLSDWHAITDRPTSLIAGNDLDMPESPLRQAALERAVREGRVSADVVDTAVERMLTLVNRAQSSPSPGVRVDAHALAVRIAEESSVLLRNVGSVLPLDPHGDSSIAVVGRGAVAPVIQAGGSARLEPDHITIPFDEITARFGSHRVRMVPHDIGDVDAVVAACADAEIILVFANVAQRGSGESVDRSDLQLDAGYDEAIDTLAGLPGRVVVVLTVPDAVVMPWLDRVDAVIAPFLAGQGMGAAIARLLAGDVNPSGKLSTTFPVRVGDIPGAFAYPGEAGRHVYVEGIHVGHRAYDLREIEPVFDFGHGLSYTEFLYADLALSQAQVERSSAVVVQFRLTNIGERRGAEIAQIYCEYPGSAVARPTRELVGSAKIMLEPGESRMVQIVVDAERFTYWDARRARRVLEGGLVVFRVGRSSRNLPLTATVRTIADGPAYRPFTAETEPSFALANPGAAAALLLLLEEKGILHADAKYALEESRNSFLSMFDTLANRLHVNFSPEDVTRTIDRAAVGEADVDAETF